MINTRQAMDCEAGPTDWAGLGARIVRAAEAATAIHLAEHAKQIARERLVETKRLRPDGPTE